MNDMHPITRGAVAITAIGSAALALWMTIVAFTGGTMPIIGLETDGGVGFGLFWLFIVDPIVMTVAMWGSMLIVAPIAAALDRG